MRPWSRPARRGGAARYGQINAALARSQRASSSKDRNKLAAIGLIPLLFYYIGIYLLLYLSRTHEYLADAFSADRVEARHLASALVKIAYGIVAVEDTEATQSLLRSTRHLGVVDVKNTFNPWAALIQLNSTHPLTGRRVAHLGEIAREKGQAFADYNIEVAAKPVDLDRGKLWRGFFAELCS